MLFSYIVPVICENLTYNSEYDIKVEKPFLFMNIIPTANLKAENITVYSKDKSNYFILKKPKIKIRLLPILSGKLHINAISAEEIKLNFLMDKNIELDKSFIERLQKDNIKLDSFNIKKLDLYIKNTENIVTKYEGNDLFYKKNGRYIKFNIHGTSNINNNLSKADINLYLPQNNDVHKSMLDVSVINFDIEPFSEFIKSYLPSEVESLKGIVDINISNNHLLANMKNCSVNIRDNVKSMIFPNELKIKSDFNITRQSINIANAEIKSKNIDVIVSGNIKNYINKSAIEENLSIRINKSRIEDFISLIPAFKTEDIDAYALKKYKFYGNILGNFKIKGDTKEPSVNGSIFINEGVLTKPIPDALGATVKLEFKDKYLNYDVVVPASRTEKVYVKGGVELYNVKYSDMRVWSTNNVDLATAEEKVVPIHEILNFLIGPVPIMTITGKGNIDINVKGNRKSPHVWGVLNFKNVSTHFNDMPDLVLNDAETVLTFDDENTVFKLNKGYVDGKDFKINGTCNFDGTFNFYVTSANQKLSYLYNAIKTSTMIDEVKNMIPDLSIVEGLTDVNLNVYGNIKDITNIKYNENLFTKGDINLLGNTLGTDKLKIHNTKGIINLDGVNTNINADAYIGNSPISFKAAVKENIADAEIYSPRLNLIETLPAADEFQKNNMNILIETKAKYKGKVDNIEYDKIDLLVKILGTGKNNKLHLSQGSINLNNGKLQIKDINGTFEDEKSSFGINLRADNILTKPSISGKIQLKDFQLYLISALTESAILPENIRNTINKIHFDKGKINLNINLNNNNINGSTDIGGIEFTYKPLELPVKVVNGSIYLRKNYLGLNKINLMADGMPILLDGGIDDIFTKQDFNLYINSKPKQDFIDKYINRYRIYPIKIKGDIVYSTKLKGIKDDYNCKAEAIMAKDASLYYLGAFVGDIENSIVLNLDTDIKNQNSFKIRDFSYDKQIDSLGKRKTRLNMLKVNGGIDLLKDDLVFHDLKIKTNNPTDARIFNIIFRKPNIKQGQFTSDLRFNGKLSNPYIIGSFHIFETEIPFLDTTMKTLTLIFKDKTTELTSKGEVFGNDIVFKGTFKNKLSAPYYIEKAELFVKILDLNYIAEKMKSTQINENNNIDTFTSFDLKNVIIKNIKLKANSIKLRNLTAKNVEANASINSKHVFKLHNFSFKAANGTIGGNFSYDIPQSLLSFDMNAKDINADDITIALFDLHNQIYGNLNGEMQLSCIGADFNKCMSTLNGNVTFNVSNGRMPKLGSLEYLLKAGNLLKGGVTSLSINSVIDIITPLKTGNFSDIYGNINITDGIAKDLEISTKGKDLSLFITGDYNFASSEANMEVLGLLSKKISTMFGPIGNVSLNTLFNVIPGIDLTNDNKVLKNINKIPGLELNSKTYRKFIAEILGNINGDNYVSSFKWIN